MRRIVVLALAGAVVMAAGPARADFFNGKDLAGLEGLKEYWSVKDGAIVGDSGPKGLKFNTFLCSKKTYGDFEMSFRVKLEGGRGNSGVQIRSKIINMKTFAVGGPQADIGAGYWGSLYGEAFGGMMKAAPKDSQKAIKPTDFNDYSIRCVGKKVTIRINGTTFIDEEFAKMPPTGIIAFQLHAGGPIVVTFDKISFRELKDGKKD